MPRKPAKPDKHKPVHPGEILKHEFLDPLGLTAYRLGKEIGVSPQHIGRIVNGLRGIGGDLALRLARFFGTSAQLWMNLQAHYEIDVAQDEAGDEIEKTIRPFVAA